MKISQKIQDSAREDKIWWSFEYFPPRTAQVPNLLFCPWQHAHQLQGLAKPVRSHRAHEGVGSRIYRHHLVSHVHTVKDLG